METKSKTTKTKNRKPTSTLSVPVYSLAGAETETLALPKEIFGAKVNKNLLAQAVRVYTSNTKGHFGSTKTRGEVEGSTRKIYRQKGTGRARHGGIRAPIFVGGGITFGPKPRKITLDLPKKMKKAALISALSQKTQDKQILGIEGLEKASGKTKQFAKLMQTLGRRSLLLVVDKPTDAVKRGTNNIQNVGFRTTKQLNAYEVLKYQALALTKEAINTLEKGGR